MSLPLIHTFDTPFQSVPFHEIKQEHFKPAIEQLLDTARREIDAIAQHPETPDFENTVAALERAGRQLNRVSEIFFNLHAAETNDYLDGLAQEISPMLAAYSNDIMLNDKLFQRIKAVSDTAGDPTEPGAGGRTGEQARLLDKTYQSFTRNGALLSDEDKEKLRAIDQELSGLTVTFSKNVLTETNAYVLHITDEEELAGLPGSIRIAAREEAQQRDLNGWVFTLQFPSLMPFLKYADNRERRKELYLANARKAFQDNEQNNETVIQRIVRLRQERAILLGFETHAHFVLQERMAGSPGEVSAFLQDMLQKAKPFAQKEVDELRALAAVDGIEQLMPYDHAYYAEKLRESRFHFSEEELKPYFSLDHVLKAAFTAAEKLYGLTFRERNDIPKYHDEVAVYEVRENGQHKALLYTDWHPRKGKRPGAWMTSFRGQYLENGTDNRPHISIVCNFARATENTPSLLTFTEVTTLFHEFGHALHGMLADTTYESLSGTNVYWDFVELPSQFMENYCYEKDFLSSFARHYGTGEVLPEDKIDKIVASANFMEGYQTVRQISFGLLDMAYHTGRFGEGDLVEHFEKEVTAATQLYPAIPGTAQSPSFSHIFAGGYAAGYYSYKWAEVLDADAFACFKETGIFNPDTAQRFKQLLSSGGTKDPMELFVAFRGRKPRPEALLKRAGLKVS